MVLSYLVTHWHAVYAERSGSYEFYNEWTESEDVVETEHEALEITHGNSHYTWSCDEQQCLDDWMPDWHMSRLWGRND